MNCTKGEINPEANMGLKQIQIDNGYVLACQCQVNNSLSIEDSDDSQLFTQAVIVKKELLSKDVCRIVLKPSLNISFRAGQFINIRMSANYIRSYSLANLPTDDNTLELHVKRMKNGLLSNWLVDTVSTNDLLEIQGPFGHCFYHDYFSERNMLLIATGTGLAPLMGILRDAIRNGHTGQIYLYHGDNTCAELYLHQELVNLILQHQNIHYFPCVSKEVDKYEKSYYYQRASDLAFQNHTNLNDHLVYLCGSPQMVEACQKLSIERNVEASHIFSDPFITKDLRTGNER